MDNEFSNKWTDYDFENMVWHDSTIYSITFSDKYELLLDIDYILKWVNLEKNDTFFQFWIAPATLIFKNVYNLKIESNIVDLIITNINRDNPQPPKNAKHIGMALEYDWLIETTQGEITFKSIGFEQHLRKSPILSNEQRIR